MKNFTKSTLLLFSILLFIASCKDKTLEDLEPLVGKKCSEKTYEQYDNGQLITKRLSEYNSLNNITKRISTSPNSTSTTLYEYDTNNNLIKQSTDLGGLIIIYKYDINKNLLQVLENGLGTVGDFEYYPNKQIKKITSTFLNTIISVKEYDEKGNKMRDYRNEYNFFQDPITQKYTFKPGKEIETIFKYDLKSNLLSQYTTHDKQFISSYEYEYDDYNNTIKATSKDLKETAVSTYSYQYDGRKRLISRKNMKGSEIKYEYNNDDLVAKETSFINNQLGYSKINEYNSAKLLIKTLQFDPMGNITSKEEKSYYSDNSLKSSQSYFTKNGAGTELFKAFDNEFTPCGGIIKSIQIGNDGTEIRRIYATYLYK